MLKIEEFHAHLYYPLDQIKEASLIVDKAKRELDFVSFGRVHTRPVGPHPIGSCQFLFKKEKLSEVLIWFLANRKDFSVFFHPVSGDDLADHTLHTFWLGKEYSLNLSIFN